MTTKTDSSSSSTTNKLSLIQLTMMIFTLTSGGPFGIETAIQSGGIFLTLIGLIIIPIVYSLPQSLMCSELGSMMPCHHGYIVWSFRAFKNEGRFGQFLGFYNAIGSTVAMAKDIPLYIAVMLFYFESFISPYHKMSWIEEYFFKFAMIIFGALINCLNIKTLGDSTVICMILVFLPFILGFIWSFDTLSYSDITSSKVYNDTNEYQLGLWLSTLIWCHTGWDTVGCLTAEISFNKNRLIFAFIFAVILCYISYTIPILGAIAVPCNDQNTDCWSDGYLYTAYNAISPYLGILVLIAGFTSNFGIYVNELSVQARTFWALAQPYVILKKSDGKMYVLSDDATIYDEDMNKIELLSDEYNDIVNNGEKIRIGMLPKWLCGSINESTGSPTKGVILQSVICCVLIMFDFAFLLQATVLINCITWCIELCSFLRLRYSEPDTHRPYKVPGGMFVAWLITIDKICLVAVLLILVLMDNPQYGFITIGSFLLSLCWFILYCWNNKRKEMRSNLKRIMTINIAEDFEINVQFNHKERNKDKISLIDRDDDDYKNYGSMIQ